MNFIRPALALLLTGVSSLAVSPAFANAISDGGPPPAMAASCADLTALREPDLRIENATEIAPAPTWTAPPVHAGGPATVTVAVPFCRVQAVIEKEITIEVWLPLAAQWNGRLLGTGNGGFAGFIRYDGLAMGVTRGFAAVSTDTGHRETEKDWAYNEPQRLENYGHRAQHLAARAAKAIIASFYGRGPNFSYFLGCSGGGMQAMNEVQRYPADYDGIIAGAAGQSIVGISARWLMSALLARDPETHLSMGEWRAIAAAAIAKCDGLDGVKDGIISDPRRCRFDAAETPGLSARKASIARQLLGPILGREGHVLFPAFLPGVAYQPIEAPGLAGQPFAQWLRNDPHWDFSGFDPAVDVPAVENATPGTSFTNPNLDAFRRRGGKLITVHGWDDPIVPVQSTIDYRADVSRYLGAATTDAFFRMFIVPGMNHCGGGAGPVMLTGSFEAQAPQVDADHDLLAALVRWREEDIAPDKVIGSHVENGKVTATRPVCAWPRLATYRGKGDSSDAANYACTGS